MKISKKLKRTLSLAVTVLLMLTTPMVSLAVEAIPEEEAKIETVIDVEESSEVADEIEGQKIIVEDPVVEAAEEAGLLEASGDTIYWGITDGVLRISVAEVGGEYSGLVSSSHLPPWYNYRNEITRVYVGDDNGTVIPTNMSSWFQYLTRVDEIHFDNIDTSNVFDMSCTFSGCTNLKSLDVSGFDTGDVKDMTEMFFDCHFLTTIYVGNGFSTEKVSDSSDMFYGCESLVGGNGTTFSLAHTDSTFARVDDPGNGNPGYFTKKVSIDILSPSVVTDAEIFVSDSVDVQARVNGVPEGTGIIFRIVGMDGFSQVKTDEDGIVAKTYKFKTEGKYSIEIAYEGQVASVGVSVNPKRMLCMVIFETNGGSAVNVQFVNENDLARKPEDPTKPDNVFAGWFSDPELTKPFDFSTPITETITLYAKWIRKSVNTPSSGSGSKPLFTGTKEKPVSDGTWNYDAETDTWSYRTTQQFAETWAYITNPWNKNKPAWFYFDGTGKMLTGWQKINWSGSYKYFYFHEAMDGQRGECQLGGITPDGYTVNEDGAWTVDGAVQ